MYKTIQIMFFVCIFSSIFCNREAKNKIILIISSEAVIQSVNIEFIKFLEHGEVSVFVVKYCRLVKT